jgi:hypothetical protein
MNAEKVHFLSDNSYDNFVYLNSLGALFNDVLVLHNNNKNVKVKLSEIRSIVVMKKRDTRWNIALLFILILLLAITFFFRTQLSFNDKILVGVISLLLAVSFFIIKQIKYKLTVFVKYELIQIKVKKNLKEEAKVLTYKTNSKIKEIQKTLNTNH